MAYRIEIRRSAQRELEKLQLRYRLQIEDKIESLALNPFPADAIALKGKTLKGLYRIKSGNFRIIYDVQHAQLVVIVIRAGDRKDIYN